MAKKKSNWDFLQKQRLGDSVKHRDVYEDQQLERTRIKEKQTFTLRVIFMLICSLVVGGVVYAIAGAIQYGHNYVEHGKQVNIVGEFSKPEDVLLVNGKALNYTRSGPMTVKNEKGEEVRKTVWIPLDENGERIGKEVYEKREDVPYPDWVNARLLEKENPDTKSEEARKILVGELSFEEAMAPDLKQIVAAMLAGMICYLIMTPFMKRNLAAQNLMSDTSDINQYQNDQHIMLPEEMQEKFDWFPDVGAHSSVQVSSMISHIAILNKGLKKVKMAKRAEKDILDEDGGIEYYKGEILLDENGEPILYEVPIIDIDFMEDLFEASGAPKDKAIRKYYDTTKINYNKDNKDREKLKGYDTVADLINGDWELPYYETQRPGGAYIVDTAPVNTMVLAITRAGKGQTVIEPTIDMWLREKNPNNMVVNDPKGELLVKNYVKATVRGFQPIQFNLINAMKTDIYNPLSMAADAAREGDFTKCALYVENIADVFFPVDGGDDPVWPNAANNAFKRAAYGLIDYYLEEEKELRLFAEKTKMEDKILENQLDAMWGKVTLYNCYQLFVQLTSKKLKNPAVEFTKEVKAGKYNSLSDDEYAEKLEKIEAEAKLWEDRPEIDMLTLFFNATAALPKNQMRTLISNADNSLKAMAGAEKMLASVYGIAITAMSFFTDPTISTLTSGTPSQNVDLAGLSFPRRIGVKFHPAFIERYHLTGLQVKWQAYEDINFEKKMSKDFYHEDLVTREGWAKYYFKGIFPEDTAYLKLEIVNPQTGFLVKTLYFKFVKSYQTSLSGKTYVKDPVLGEKIVKNGLLTELRKVKNKETGEIIFKKGKTTFPSVKMKDIETQPHKDKVNAHAIVRTMVRYSEKPKTVFLVTPPHLMKYAKLILILIKQLVDLNFDQSYMTKANQKPLYKTRFMLDELGNLQSEGHGISGFETMLSIGLGQEQQFTLILQTLQQLRDVYGESVDKIVQGNTSNIVFLKSTDDSMLDTLQKMSGTTHRSFTDSKTVTRDAEKVILQTEGKVSYTMTTREVPVISYNDMAFISERNSIVFRAGDSPIWNRNETILPMSWRLFKDTITQPGKEYTLQTIPTLSSAKDFDVRKNQPNFGLMLEKRKKQAIAAELATEVFQTVYDYTDYQMEQLDPDVKADEIMEVINTSIREEIGEAAENEYDYSDYMEDEWSTAEENTEQIQATAQIEATYKSLNDKIYAEGMLSRASLMGDNGIPQHSFDNDIIAVYNEVKSYMWKDTGYFRYDEVNGVLYGINGLPYIIKERSSASLDVINKAAESEDTRVFGEEPIEESHLNALGTFRVTDDFYRFLTSLSSWDFANRMFEREMAKRMKNS